MGYGLQGAAMAGSLQQLLMRRKLEQLQAEQRAQAEEQRQFQNARLTRGDERTERTATINEQLKARELGWENAQSLEGTVPTLDTMDPSLESVQVGSRPQFKAMPRGGVSALGLPSVPFTPRTKWDVAEAGQAADVRELEMFKKKADITAQAKPPSPGYQWVNRNGQPVRVSEGELQPGDKPWREASESGMAALYEAVDPEAIANGIEAGDLSPEIEKYGRPAGAAVSSVLAKRGVNVTRKVNEWKSVQRFYLSKQGTQQLRIRQSADVILQSMDEVDRLSQAWKAGGFKTLNRAELYLAQQGAYGEEAASLATQLEAQIAESVEAMANVYMGGNTPTDKAMKLAEQQLRGNWSAKVLADATALVRKNTNFRLNAINDIGPSGINPQSPYILPQGGQAAPTGGALVEDPPGSGNWVRRKRE